MSWTDADIQHMTDLARAGQSAAQVGKALGRSRNAVLGKAHRIGLCFGPQKDPGQAGKKPTRRKPPRPSSAAAAPEIAAPPPAAKPAPRITGRYAPAPLLDLRDDQCRFPLWQPGDAVRNCCGAERDIVDPYCPEHMKRTHTPVALAAGRRKRARHAGGRETARTGTNGRWG